MALHNKREHNARKRTLKLRRDKIKKGGKIPEGKGVAYSKFIQQSYNKYEKRPIEKTVNDDYTLVKENSRFLVYKNDIDKEVVIAIRGTEWKSLDILTDVLIVKGIEKLSPRYALLKSRVKSIIKKYYPEYRIVLAGHSLGARMVQDLISSLDEIDKGYTYAPPATPGNLGPSSTKITSSKVKGDPVSLFAKVSYIQPRNPSATSAHSLKNWTG